MVQMKYVEYPDCCFICEHLIDQKCVKHNLSVGKISALTQNPYRLVETLINSICDNGFKRKVLKPKN